MLFDEIGHAELNTQRKAMMGHYDRLFAGLAKDRRMMTRRRVGHPTVRSVDDTINRRRKFDMMVIEKNHFVCLLEHCERPRALDLQRSCHFDGLFCLTHFYRCREATAANVAYRERDPSAGQREDVVPIASELLNCSRRPV